MTDDVERGAQIADDIGHFIGRRPEPRRHRHGIIATQQLPEIPRRGEHVVKPAVGDEERLAAAVLAVGHAGQIDARLAHQPAAKFECEAARAQRSRAFAKHVAQRLAQRINIERRLAREIGNSKATTEVYLGRFMSGLIGNLPGKRHARALRLDDRRPVEALRTGVEVQPAPVGPGLDQSPHHVGGAVVVDPERRGGAPHLHPRALQLERRIDPNHHLGASAELPANVEQAGRFAFALDADRGIGLNRAFKLAVGLAGAGETQREACCTGFLERRQFPLRCDIEAVDEPAHPF